MPEQPRSNVALTPEAMMTKIHANYRELTDGGQAKALTEPFYQAFLKSDEDAQIHLARHCMSLCNTIKTLSPLGALVTVAMVGIAQNKKLPEARHIIAKIDKRVRDEQKRKQTEKAENVLVG